MTPIDGPDSGAEHADTPTTADAPDVPGVGSVAEEAARLVDLLSERGWPGSSGMPSGAPRANGHAHHPDTPGGDERRSDGAGAPGHGGAGHAGAGEPVSGRECTCGGTTPAACRVCPVCQLIAFVQQVNPDTIDRVADFVGFAATALRDLATAQRERRTEPDEATPSGPPAAAADDPERTRPGDPT